MGKTLGKVAMVVGGIALIATGVGAALGGTMMFAGIASTTWMTIASVMSVGAAMLTKPPTPKASPANRDRLNLSLNPHAPRTMAFGSTALATDIRDQEFSGTDKEFLHRFVVVAAHRVNAIREIWFDDKIAWTSAGGVQGEFVNFLTVQTILEGSAANAINLGARMGSSRRFTGCAYVYLRYRLSATGTKKKPIESPFSGSVPSRVTIVGDGMPCYDPRQDSTVAGGSGAHRADNQATWTWGAHCRNPAVQLGTYLLGWRINGKLSVGKGIPKNRVDWPSFITAANLCDEPVTLVSGGTEPRYRADGMFNEGERPLSIIDQFKVSMNADLDDQDGLLRLTVYHNDLAVNVPLTEDDILGEFKWQQTQPLDTSFNIVRGSFVDASNLSLYQMNEYKEVSVASPDGIDRIHTAEYGMVQSKSQAERLSKQRLQRQLYGGTFQATFQATAWRVQKGSVVRLTFSPEGWVDKLFRVAEITTQVTGEVPMTLREENAQIYAWDKSEGPAVVHATPTYYAPRETPIARFIDTVEEGANVTETRTSLNTSNVGTRTAAVVNSDLDNLINKSLNYDASFVTVNSQISDLNTFRSAQNTLNSQLQSADSTLQTNINTVQSNLNSAQSTLQNADATLQGNINSTNSSLNSLWSSFGANDQSGFRARIIATETTGTNHASRISGVESSLNTPTTGALARIGTLESTVVSASNSHANRISSLESTFNTPTTGALARITSLETVTSNGTFATATRVNNLETTFNTRHSNAEARITTVETAVTDGRFATATRVDNLETTFNTRHSNAEARITTVETATTDGRFASATRVTNIESTLNTPTTGALARITSLENTTSSDSQSQATRLTNLEATFNTPTTGALARISSLETVTSNGTFATASRVNDMETNFNTEFTNAKSRITSLETITSNGTFASATRVTNLESTLNTPTTGVTARLSSLESTYASESSALADRTTNIESEITNARGGYGNLSAKIGTFAGTVADALAGKASATSVSDLSATVNGIGGRVTTVESVSTTTAGKVNASRTVTVDANGNIAGYRIHAASGDTDVSTFDVLASTFRVSNGAQKIAPFTVSGSDVLIHGKLNVFSSTSGERVQLLSNKLEVYDTGGNLRVELGVLS